MTREITTRDDGDDAVRAKGTFIQLDLTLVVVAFQVDGLQSVRRRSGMLDPEVFVDGDAKHFTDRAKRGERRVRRFAAEILPDGVLGQAGSFGQLLVGDTRICRIFLVTA